MRLSLPGADRRDRLGIGLHHYRLASPLATGIDTIFHMHIYMFLYSTVYQSDVYLYLYFAAGCSTGPSELCPVVDPPTRLDGEADPRRIRGSTFRATSHKEELGMCS